MRPVRAFAIIAFACFAFAAWAADYPAPKQSEWIARDFKFHTGEVLPEVRISYTTVGAPTGQPVLVLHGTTGNAGTMLTPVFAGELFGAGAKTGVSMVPALPVVPCRTSTGCPLGSPTVV